MGAVHHVFARDHHVEERARANGPDFRLRLRPDTGRLRHLAIARAVDVFDGLNAGYHALFDVETRDPTGDQRIVEFCLSLPENQYRRAGQRRWLVRRAMRDRLPREILDNPKRGFQVADWLERMRRARRRIEDELSALEACDLARRAVDLARLRGLVRRLPHADAALPSTISEYRWALEFGLMTGRFIRWFEAQERPTERI